MVTIGLRAIVLRVNVLRDMFFADVRCPTVTHTRILLSDALNVG